MSQDRDEDRDRYHDAGLGQYDDDEPARAPGISPGKASMTSRIGSTARSPGRVSPGKRALTTQIPTRRTDEDPTFAAATSGEASGVPFRSGMETLFGESFSDVQAFTGRADALSPVGARAAAQGDAIAFADSKPDASVVAHELTHVVQQRHAGATALAASKGQSDPSDASEREAEAVAAHVAARGMVGPLPAITAAPSARVHFDRGSGPAADTAVAPEGSIPDGLEQAIRGLLGQQLAKTAVREIWERRQRLVQLFEAVASPYREALLQRLTGPADDDGLAAMFRERLATATRSQLVAILRGRAVARLDAHDEWIGSWIHDHIYRAGIRVSPDPVVMGPWMDEIAVGLRIGDPSSMYLPREYGALELRWSIERPDGEVLALGGSWPIGASESEEVSVQAMAAGTLRVGVEILLDGVLLKEDRREIEVIKEQHNRAALLLGDEELGRQMSGVREQLADTSLGEGERTQMMKVQTALNFAAGEREGFVAPAPDAGPERYQSWQPGEWSMPALSADPVFLRYIVEQQFASGGWMAVHDLYFQLGRFVHADQRDEERRYGLMVWQAVGAQRALLQQEHDLFIVEFERTAKAKTGELLEQSHQRIEDAIQQYGLTAEVVFNPSAGSILGTLLGQVGSGLSVTHAGEANEHTESLAATARELATFQREIEAIELRLADLTSLVECDNLIDDDLDWQIDGSYPGEKSALEESCDEAAATNEQERSLEAAAQLRPLLNQVKVDFLHLRSESEAKHPVLAAYHKDDRYDLAGLNKLATSGFADFAARIFEARANNQKAREGLESGDLDVWKVPDIVGMGRIELMVRPGSPQDAAIRQKLLEKQVGDTLKGVGILAVTLGLALLAAIPTGGAGGAVVVGLAEAGGVAYDIYQLVDTVQQYQLDKAAAGSDYDKAQALSSIDPSLFWVAVELVGTGVGVGGAVKSFKAVKQSFSAISSARRSIIEARNVGHLSERLEELEKTRRAAGLSDEAGARLADDALEETAQRGDDVGAAAAAQRTRAARLPQDGTWTGEPGNSVFIPNRASKLPHPDDPRVVDLPPGEGIPFRNGRPDFSRWAVDELDVPGLDGSARDRGRMALAVAERYGLVGARGKPTAAVGLEYMERLGVVPHHAGGTKVQLVPHGIHGSAAERIGVPHAGGASDLRNQSGE